MKEKLHGSLIKREASNDASKKREVKCAFCSTFFTVGAGVGE